MSASDPEEHATVDFFDSEGTETRKHLSTEDERTANQDTDEQQQQQQLYGTRRMRL